MKLPILRSLKILIFLVETKLYIHLTLTRFRLFEQSNHEPCVSHLPSKAQIVAGWRRPGVLTLSYSIMYVSQPAQSKLINKLSFLNYILHLLKYIINKLLIICLIQTRSSLVNYKIKYSNLYLFAQNILEQINFFLFQTTKLAAMSIQVAQ